MTILLLIPALWFFLILYHRKNLIALWEEPVLRYPVLIIESDDWGPGPEKIATSLNRLSELLEGHQDRWGNPPHLTLGVLLSIPDKNGIIQSGYSAYYRRPLSDSQFKRIRSAMQRGTASRVFSLQLHGMEHLWPPALMQRLRTDSALKKWLTRGPWPDTIELPSPLQSRWTNGSSLPSKKIPADEIESAVFEETETFAKTFGYRAKVAVPPTFVWNQNVEKAWAKTGIKVIVTPGLINTKRDEKGKPESSGKRIRNGNRNHFGSLYIVRNRYFEPSFGHTAEKILKELKEDNKTGRPTILETHSFNFTTEKKTIENSFHQLDLLLKMSLEQHPDLLFLSTEKLAELFSKKDPEYLYLGKTERIHAWFRRMYHLRPFRNAASVSGLVIPGFLIYLLNGYAGTIKKKHPSIR